MLLSNHVKAAGTFIVLFCIACCLILSLQAKAASDSPVVITISKQDKVTASQNIYFHQLLKAIMDITQTTHGSYRIETTSDVIPQERAVLMLAKRHRINLVWTMTSEKRENTLLPIRIPLLKGLLGYRIFIIKKSNLEKFAAIQSADQLKALVAGQGKGWPDTDILRNNGFKVLTSPSYQSLFNMLEANRFDYFPRGIHEPWGELKQTGRTNLVVEPNLILHYPAPLYFFVAKEDQLLHQRINTGLELLIQQGIFDQLFYAQESVKQALTKTNIPNRKLITLDNKNLSELTPIHRRELWLTPEDPELKLYP
jgi:hypothetical protein